MTMNMKQKLMESVKLIFPGEPPEEKDRIARNCLIAGFVGADITFQLQASGAPDELVFKTVANIANCMLAAVEMPETIEGNLSSTSDDWNVLMSWKCEERTIIVDFRPPDYFAVNKYDLRKLEEVQNPDMDKLKEIFTWLWS